LPGSHGLTRAGQQGGNWLSKARPTLAKQLDDVEVRPMVGPRPSGADCAGALRAGQNEPPNLRQAPVQGAPGEIDNETSLESLRV